MDYKLVKFCFVKKCYCWTRDLDPVNILLLFYHLKRTVTNKTVEYVCEKLAIFDSFLLEIIWDIFDITPPPPTFRH